MATETNLTKLNINKLTAAQYLEADIQGQIDPNELYVLKDAIYDSKVVIDDTKTSDSTTYSSNKIKNDLKNHSLFHLWFVFVFYRTIFKYIIFIYVC